MVQHLNNLRNQWKLKNKKDLNYVLLNVNFASNFQKYHLELKNSNVQAVKKLVNQPKKI